jgi:hypothetical protein
VLEKKKTKKQTVRRELQQTHGLYSAAARITKRLAVALPLVRRFIPAVGGLIGVVATPAVDIGALDVL